MKIGNALAYFFLVGAAKFWPQIGAVLGLFCEISIVEIVEASKLRALIIKFLIVCLTPSFPPIAKIGILSRTTALTELQYKGVLTHSSADHYFGTCR